MFYVDVYLSLLSELKGAFDLFGFVGMDLDVSGLEDASSEDRVVVVFH